MFEWIKQALTVKFPELPILLEEAPPTERDIDAARALIQKERARIQIVRRRLRGFWYVIAFMLLSGIAVLTYPEPVALAAALLFACLGISVMAGKQADYLRAGEQRLDALDGGFVPAEKEMCVSILGWRDYPVIDIYCARVVAERPFMAMEVEAMRAWVEGAVVRKAEAARQAEADEACLALYGTTNHLVRNMD
jgi:hypothetical protein